MKVLLGQREFFQSWGLPWLPQTSRSSRNISSLYCVALVYLLRPFEILLGNLPLKAFPVLACAKYHGSLKSHASEPNFHFLFVQPVLPVSFLLLHSITIKMCSQL